MMRPTSTFASLVPGVEAAALGAVVDVESAGSGVTAAGPLIRLEVHQLWRRVPLGFRGQVDARFRVGGPKPWEGHRWLDDEGVWRDLHQPGTSGQILEWAAYRCAVAIHPESAVLATSWGLAQILGTHWQECGFASPAAFVNGQSTEAGQIASFAALVTNTPAFLAALRAKDWRGFAAAYNGPGKVDDYGAKIAAAYARRTT